MTGMLDRIAKAIRTYIVYHTGNHYGIFDSRGDGLLPICREKDEKAANAECDRLNARAMLEAMREPTPEMLAAAWNVFNREPRKKLGPGPAFKEALVAMIDAAMK